MENKSSHVVISAGNAGCQILRTFANRSSSNGTKMFAIDSVVSGVTLDNINTNVKFIPIISDENSGSGRDRERGAAMFKYHEDQGAFDEMYAAAESAKSPVVVISSAAGGTGSGSIVPLCRSLIELGIHVIPIIVCPSMDDPDAYHLNTNDLFIELDEVGVETYNVFRNRAGDSNYGPINNEVADLIEIIFGKRYHDTSLDSIDDQDLDVILSTPGRFVAITAAAPDIPKLTREITTKMFTGFQPSWTEDDAKKYTFMSAFSLRSIFASNDFKSVFDEVRSRIKRTYDEYRHIEQCDNNGICEATVIIAGLPRPEIKDVEATYADVGGISSGMNRSKRPAFMKRKKASITDKKDSNGNSHKEFKWV
jgi:hypothetical protein